MSKEDRAYVIAFGVLASVLALWIAGIITIGGLSLGPLPPHEHTHERGSPSPTLRETRTALGRVGSEEDVEADENPDDVRDVSEASLLLGEAGLTGASLSSEDSLSLSTTLERLYWVPTKRTLLHFYRSEAPQAGLYDEERELLLVDPLLVDRIWSEDKGLRAALARACEITITGWEAWAQGRTDVADLLERDRVTAVAELWLYYSPDAYATYVGSLGR